MLCDRQTRADDQSATILPAKFRRAFHQLHRQAQHRARQLHHRLALGGQH